MATPFEAIYQRSPYLAQLSSDNGELAHLFMKAIQAIYMFATSKNVDPLTINYSIVKNSDGLIFTLNGKYGSVTMTRNVYSKRFQDFTKITERVKGLMSLFISIYKYAKDHKQITAKLSRSGEKFILCGEKK